MDFLCLLASDGFTKTLIVHLEGGSYLATADRFAPPAGIWIISARICALVWGLGTGMLTSPVSDTEKSVSAERKTPQWGSEADSAEGR